MSAPLLSIVMCWVLVVAFALARGAVGLSPTLPRGVSPQDAGFYAKSASFTCRDGSSTIPYSRVNDDYCDCADGSDEPGTPACSSLGSNATFYCLNRGDDPKVIQSMFVDDGICDCCDGSDEKSGVCENRCVELGRETLRGLEEEWQGARKGLQKKGELSRCVDMFELVCTYLFIMLVWLILVIMATNC
jgi:protein kinase C substrate 80K-H